MLWLNLLFRRGAVTVDHYLGSFSASTVDLGKPPPEIDAEFRLHVEKAIALAERRVAANPKDAQAHYELGQRRTSGVVRRDGGRKAAGWLSRRTSAPYDEHEKALALDPSRKDAALVVGTYRYVVSTESLPMRMLAYVAGIRRRTRTRHPDARGRPQKSIATRRRAQQVAGSNAETTPRPTPSSR